MRGFLVVWAGGEGEFYCVIRKGYKTKRVINL